MDRVTIVGMGLIGTSIGLGLKKAKLDEIELLGTDMDSSASGKASRKGAVDKINRNLAASVEGARLVILATPVMAMKEVMQVIGSSLEEGCTVTDTGSTKAEIMGWAKEYLPSHVSFVGGHPMAGKEQSGPDAAEDSLFQGTTYCILPGDGARPEAVKTVTSLAEALGATPLFMDVQEHDSFVAAASHLPMVLSTALVTSLAKSPSWPEISSLASSGFRDVSRLASGEFQKYGFYASGPHGQHGQPEIAVRNRIARLRDAPQQQCNQPAESADSPGFRVDVEHLPQVANPQVT